MARRLPRRPGIRSARQRDADAREAPEAPGGPQPGCSGKGRIAEHPRRDSNQPRPTPRTSGPSRQGSATTGSRPSRATSPTRPTSPPPASRSRPPRAPNVSTTTNLAAGTSPHLRQLAGPRRRPRRTPAGPGRGRAHFQPNTLDLGRLLGIPLVPLILQAVDALLQLISKIQGILFHSAGGRTSWPLAFYKLCAESATMPLYCPTSPAHRRPDPHRRHRRQHPRRPRRPAPGDQPDGRRRRASPFTRLFRLHAPAAADARLRRLRHPDRARSASSSASTGRASPLSLQPVGRLHPEATPSRRSPATSRSARRSSPLLSPVLLDGPTFAVK